VRVWRLVCKGGECLWERGESHGDWGVVGGREEGVEVEERGGGLGNGLFFFARFG